MIKITKFADDSSHCWDQETGMPTEIYFGNAVQVWSLAQDRPVTILEAANVFNVRQDLIRDAVENHPWMYLNGNLIEHDGE